MSSRVPFCIVMLLAQVSNAPGQVAENGPTLPTSPIVNPVPDFATSTATPGQKGQDGQEKKDKPSRGYLTPGCRFALLLAGCAAAGVVPGRATMRERADLCSVVQARSTQKFGAAQR